MDNNIPDSTYSKFHIVFPRGDRTRLSVAEISDCSDYEIDDYSVASRMSFRNPLEAHLYAKELAAKNGLTYKADKDHIGHEATYLD